MAAAIGAAVLIALLAAFASVFRLGLLPPKLEQRSLAVGAATAHAIVGPKLERGDLTDVDTLTESYQIDTRIDRATLVANVHDKRQGRRPDRFTDGYRTVATSPPRPR